MKEQVQQLIPEQPSSSKGVVPPMSLRNMSSPIRYFPPILRLPNFNAEHLGQDLSGECSQYYAPGVSWHSALLCFQQSLVKGPAASERFLVGLAEF